MNKSLITSYLCILFIFIPFLNSPHNINAAVFPFPAMATWNKETALQSARKLLEYKPSLLAVGHGKMLKQPEKAITHAITKAKLNIEHI